MMDPEHFDRRFFNFVTTARDYGPREGSMVSDGLVSVLSRFGIGTWNVSGCIRESSRLDIDEFLLGRDIHLAFLQETHLVSGSLFTPNYRWYNSGGSGTRTARGVSVLVRISSGVEVWILLILYF